MRDLPLLRYKRAKRIVTRESSSDIPSLLTAIYGDDGGEDVPARFAKLIEKHATQRPGRRRPQAWLIAYPDHISGAPSPLASLRRFVDAYLPEQVEGVHVLPCYPSTSDEGFSVVDYVSIEPSFGSWGDIEELAAKRHVMLDAVINHASARGVWFEEWRNGAPERVGFFRTEDPNTDLSAVVRARQHPLLTRFDTNHGPEWVWTTFSADQADLDYRNPNVTLAVAEVLLEYARHGATAIRLDAIGFLWKDASGPSIHLEQTHLIIRLYRALLDATYPDVVLVSETNVPHEENVSYLGSTGVREADLVYQFPLPPLVLHAYATENGSALKKWLESIGDIPPHTAFFNFLASHDGVGLRPLEGMVPTSDVELLIESTTDNGGLVSFRSGPDGSEVPYELNGTWFDLIRGASNDDDALAKHLSSHALMLALAGEPAIYLQSFLAERNAGDLAAHTGRARSINRRRFTFDELEAMLADPASDASQSLTALSAMLSWRAATDAFSSTSPQVILDTPDSVIGIERVAPDGTLARVFVNVSSSPVSIRTTSGESAHGVRAEVDGDALELGPWGFAMLSISAAVVSSAT